MIKKYDLILLLLIFSACQTEIHTKQAAADDHTPPVTMENRVNLSKKSCHNGVATACHQLGMLYLEGTVVKKDLPRAKQYLKRACNLGDQKGCKELKKMEKPKQTGYREPNYRLAIGIFDLLLHMGLSLFP